MLDGGGAWPFGRGVGASRTVILNGLWWALSEGRCEDVVTQVLLKLVSKGSALAAVKWCPLSVCFDACDVAEGCEGIGFVWAFDFSEDQLDGAIL